MFFQNCLVLFFIFYSLSAIITQVIVKIIVWVWRVCAQMSLIFYSSQFKNNKQTKQNGKKKLNSIHAISNEIWNQKVESFVNIHSMNCRIIEKNITYSVLMFFTTFQCIIEIFIFSFQHSNEWNSASAITDVQNASEFSILFSHITKIVFKTNSVGVSIRLMLCHAFLFPSFQLYRENDKCESTFSVLCVILYMLQARRCWMFRFLFENIQLSVTI